MTSLVPEEIRVSDKGQTLHLRFEDGGSLALSAEFLRVHSPSAEVQGHAAHERKTVGGKRGCAITEIVTVGNYAIRPTFSDGHDTGIYAWGHLLDLGRTHDEKWQTYLNELAAKGLSRDRPGEA